MKKLPLLILLATPCLFLSCSSSNDDTPTIGKGIYLTGAVFGGTSRIFMHYKDNSVIWTNPISTNIAGAIKNSDNTWKYIGLELHDQSGYNIFEYSNGQKEAISSLNGCFPTSIDNLSENSSLSGFCPWKGDGQGFIKVGEEVTFIDTADRIVIDASVVDNSGRIHSTGHSHGASFHERVGLPYYWIDGVLQVLSLPDLMVRNIFPLNVNGDIQIFGSGFSFDGKELSLFKVTSTNTTELYKFEANELGFHNVGRLRSFGNDLYWLGSYKVFHNDRQGSYGFYIKNGEMIKIEDANVIFSFNDILISGNNEHLVGTTTSKFTGASSSIYLLNRTWLYPSGEDGLELLELYHQQRPEF